MKKRQTGTQFRLVGSAVAVAIVLTVAGFQAAWFLGLHLHELPDGRTVVHSHPIEKARGGGEQHQHSDRDYSLLGEAGKIQPVHTVGYCPVIVPFTPREYVARFAGGVQCPENLATAFSRRGPPLVTSV